MKKLFKTSLLLATVAVAFGVRMPSLWAQDTVVVGQPPVYYYNYGYAVTTNAAGTTSYVVPLRPASSYSNNPVYEDHGVANPYYLLDRVGGDTTDAATVLLPGSVGDYGGYYY